MHFHIISGSPVVLLARAVVIVGRHDENVDRLTPRPRPLQLVLEQILRNLVADGEPQSREEVPHPASMLPFYAGIGRVAWRMWSRNYGSWSWGRHLSAFP